MLSEETRRKLREMNFGELVEALDLQENQPEYMALTFDERMNLAVDYTYSAKYNSKVHRLINAAKFRIADAALANVHYEKRGLDKDLILTLGNCGFIEKNQPVVFVCRDSEPDTFVFLISWSCSARRRWIYTAEPKS